MYNNMVMDDVLQYFMCVICDLLYLMRSIVTTFWTSAYLQWFSMKYFEPFWTKYGKHKPMPKKGSTERNNALRNCKMFWRMSLVYFPFVRHNASKLPQLQHVKFNNYKTYKHYHQTIKLNRYLRSNLAALSSIKQR